LDNKITKISIIILPIKHLIIIILCGTFDAFILRLYESVPLCPAGILLFKGPLLIGISLFIANQFIEICEHVDKDAGLLAFG
jgi:hypothetical protein